jgi:hypothetical protein
VTRRQPTTVRPWQRWLLVVLTVVGVGAWQGAHCTGQLPAALAGGTTSGSVTAAAGHAVSDGAAPAVAAASSPHEHGDTHTPGHPQRPGPAAADCETVGATVVAATAATAVAVPAGTRGISASRPCAPRLAQRPLSGMTLAHIGVSRT